jgi:hypothetical protein
MRRSWCRMCSMNSNRGRIGTSTGKVSFSFGGIGAYLDRGREGVFILESSRGMPPSTGVRRRWQRDDISHHIKRTEDASRGSGRYDMQATRGLLYCICIWCHTKRQLSRAQMSLCTTRTTRLVYDDNLQPRVIVSLKSSFPKPAGPGSILTLTVYRASSI